MTIQVADDPVSAQLLGEQQKGAERISIAINYPYIEGGDGPDDLLAQTSVAIINNSLQGEPNTQKTGTGPVQRHESRASPEIRKRQVSENAPVSPSKRRLPVRGAATMGRKSPGAGKLGRPAFIFGDLNRNKARGVEEEPKDAPTPAIRSLRSRKATPSVTPGTIEAHKVPAEAANPGSGGRKTRSQAAKVNGAEAERTKPSKARGEQPQQDSTYGNGHSRKGRPKKSVEGGLAHSVASSTRTTRSGDRHLRDTELKVVIPVADLGKNPEDILKANKGGKRPRRDAKPSVGSKALDHQQTVQTNSNAGLTDEPQSPITKETRMGTRNSGTGNSKGGKKFSANVPTDQVFGDLSDEHDHIDDKNSDDESGRASEHENEVEKMVTDPGGSARSGIAVDTGSPEASGQNEDVDSESDNGGGEGSELSDSADVADEEDGQDSGTVHDRPTAKMPFEQQANWERAMKSASSVGQSERKGVIEHKKPRLVTSAIKTILGLSSELKQLFLEYGPLYTNQDHLDESSSSRAMVLRTDINNKLMELKTVIAEIEEANAGKMKKKMIRDIFAHGIPELVFLLNEVFLCYFSTSSVRTSGLMLSLLVHEQVLILCRTAVRWGAQLNTDWPIKRPTRQSIFPVLREMRTVFRTEQQKMKILVMSKKQMLASKRQLEKSQEMERRKHEQFELEKDAFLERQKAALDEEEERMRLLRRKYTSGDVPRSSSSTMPLQEDSAGETATSPDSDNRIERVEMFVPRGEGAFHPKRENGKPKRAYNLNDTVPSWTDEEREWLMIGLQLYRGETCQLCYMPHANMWLPQTQIDTSGLGRNMANRESHCSIDPLMTLFSGLERRRATLKLNTMYRTGCRAFDTCRFCHLFRAWSLVEEMSCKGDRIFSSVRSPTVLTVR